MVDKSVCFSHKSDDWRTPSSIYNILMDLGYVDPCPFNSDFNGLAIDYNNKKIFINPPYSQLKIWCEYAIKQFLLGNDVVLLIPARTDTKAFHLLLEYSPKIIFIKGRLHFNDSKVGAPFPSLFVVLDHLLPSSVYVDLFYLFKRRF